MMLVMFGLKWKVMKSRKVGSMNRKVMWVFCWVRIWVMCFVGFGVVVVVVIVDFLCWEWREMGGCVMVYCMFLGWCLFLD